MAILIFLWFAFGFVGLMMSASKKAGDKTITLSDFVGALIFGPLLMLIAAIMPSEASYDKKQTDSLLAGDISAFNKDHIDVLLALHRIGSYDPSNEKPIIWDTYRTQRVLSDLVAMPNSLVNKVDGRFTLSKRGLDVMAASGFTERFRN